MANRFWVAGGTGNWNSTTNWSTTSGGASGASVPGSADVALFNASSGSGTATLDISPTIQSLNCSGFTGTLAFGSNTITVNSTGTIYTGSLTMTVTGTPLIIATDSSATARTITPTAVTEANSISFRITGGTGTLTLTAGGYRDLDFTDGVNPTGYAGALASTSVSVYGNFKSSTGMSVTAGTGVFTFAATSGTKTINPAGVIFDRPFTFNGVGGTWQLLGALTSGSARTTTLTNGTLDLNGYTLTTGIFASSNANTRTVAFGSGNITITGSGTTVYSITDATNLSYTGTPTINCTYSGSTGTRTIRNGLYNTSGSAAIAANINISAGSDTANIQGHWNNVDFTGFSGVGTFSCGCYGNFTLSSTMTSSTGIGALTLAATSGVKTFTSNGVTINRPVTFDGVGGTWAMQDALTLDSASALTVTNGTVQLKAGATTTVGSFATSGTNQKYLQSTSNGVRATLSQASGTVNASYLTIKDINAAGGATWNAPYSSGNIDGGNNIGWNFGDSPQTVSEVTYSLRSFTTPRRF